MIWLLPPNIRRPLVLVFCRDNRGQYFKKSLYKTARVTYGDLSFRLEDFTKICEDHYVAFPGQEKELEEYLMGVDEEQR